MTKTLEQVAPSRAAIEDAMEAIAFSHAEMPSYEQLCDGWALLGAVHEMFVAPVLSAVIRAASAQVTVMAR